MIEVKHFAYRKYELLLFLVRYKLLEGRGCYCFYVSSPSLPLLQIFVTVQGFGIFCVQKMVTSLHGNSLYREDWQLVYKLLGGKKEDDLSRVLGLWKEHHLGFESHL